jgi:hypothetical protein
MVRLNWEKKATKPRSSFWFEALVPQLGWTYIVDKGVVDPKKYTCFMCIDCVVYTESRITSHEFKTLLQAQTFCERHLLEIFSKLKIIFQ